jgi:hypothetical protein
MTLRFFLRKTKRQLNLFNLNLLTMRTLYYRDHRCKWLSVVEKLPLGLLFLLLSLNLSYAQKGNLVPTNASQSNFLKAYKLAFHSADKDFRTLGTKADTQLFKPFGEYSVYWITSGPNKGSLVYPDSLPTNLLTNTPYASSYNWQAESHLSIHYKALPKKIAIFRSNIKVNDYSINWEAQNFRSLFETYLENNSYYFLDEPQLAAKNISDTTSLLIIPAFMGEKRYIDSLLSIYPNVGDKIKSFLSTGGTIYAEGNAVYFLEAAGILNQGTVNFDNPISSVNNMVKLNAAADHPTGYASTLLNNEVYATSIPFVNSSGISVISSAAADNRPVLFTITGGPASNGRIIGNLGLPTSGGISKVEQGSRQLQWTLNAILYAFAQKIDISRAVINQIPSNVMAHPNFVSHDRLDTLDVKITVRNLSSESIPSIQLSEDFRNYFQFLEMVSSVPYTLVDGNLKLELSLGPKTEQQILFRLRTPDIDASIHSKVDKFIDYDTYMAASINKTTYTDAEGIHSYNKTRNYADIMFSARIMGDADVNWKNFLSLEYQPFKVFMIMENKERTQAENTIYTQYIPKDVPFYWTDSAINIPILKTPGGEYVDILRGSDDEKDPEYDLDSDGKPDVWLDTTSIFPKGYTIKEDSVYWANPWAHLRTGNNQIIFEDIDHDGKVAEDTNGDGIADIEEPGDKIRVWKVTWNIGTVKGYDYFDPYCSYELWVDPPDMVKMAAGVGHVYGTLTEDVPGMFYPYTPDISKANKSDNRWKRWMDKKGSETIWKQYIFQHMQNYLGYTFIDTAAIHYQLKPYDKCGGTTPQPHEEFLAVLSMGGEEIDMQHPTPSQSLYSKINYKTIFNEDRVTPIRTTYSYYAPLPNPLQFEYLASNFAISDTLGNKLDFLPAKGKAHLQFDLDASTEYTYYWIRNVGHKVDRKPDWIKDPLAGMGTGVFGYMIYEIPKGMGGYHITLPKKQDGTYDTDSIVKVDGKPFQKWLDNPNTANKIEIWEDPYNYQVYIPQLLIPPALDDDNLDGIDDWIDDRGDRFQSSTGYLHDAFMPGNGEDYPNKPVVPFEDLGYGTVTSGWDSGSDNTYGDDTFENLGKTHFTIHASYEGTGREGSVDISKGGTLVVEEIFGGSPWVIFSHVLLGYAKGVDYKLTSIVSPSAVKYGTDTVVIKHTLEDINEPHEFNYNFDPYHVSIGYGEASITSLAGGKDPCSLLSPEISTSTIIDPKTDRKTITLIPAATSGNPDLVGYPRQVSGTFLEVKVEVTNGTNDNWFNTTVKPVLSGLGNTKLELAYVAYPRPLVPSHALADKVVPGDQPGTFTTGWRFNQPDGEVLVKMGDTLNLMQPTRRGYFIFLFRLDENLKKGIYSIDFTMDGKRLNYKGNNPGRVNFNVPSVLFSITEKATANKPKEYQKFKIDHGVLTDLKVNGSSCFEGTKQVKYSNQDVDYTQFNTLTNTLPATYNNNIETIDLSKVSNLPNADTAKLYLLEKVVVNSYRGGEDIDLTTDENMSYTYDPYGKLSVAGNKLTVSPYGPRILINQRLYSVNGRLVDENYKVNGDTGKLYVVTRLDVLNAGSDVSENTIISVHPGAVYTVLADSLKPGVTFSNGLISANVGTLAPGESKPVYIYYSFVNVSENEDLMTVIKLSDIQYTSQTDKAIFKYVDTTKVTNGVQDLKLQDIETTDAGANTYSITVTAKNIGIPVKNAVLRIYAIVGGEIIQFPIAEKSIDLFNTGEIVTLQVNYSIPGNEKIEVFAKIDDDETITEINEGNNSNLKLVINATGVKELKNELEVQVFPNPCAENVSFAYNLDKIVDDVRIAIYNQKGSSVVLINNCPRNPGWHTIQCTLDHMASGNYLYKMEIKNKGEKPSVRTGILIKN